MKKILCLLLSTLLMMSFVACGEEEYIEEYYEDTATVETTKDTTATYGDAIRLMMKTFDNSFTKEDLKSMFPDECWTHFEEKNGESLDQIYTSFSGKMAEKWKQTQEEVGEGAAVKYEILNRADYVGSDYEALKAELVETYGISPDSIGICYEVKVKKATMGKLLEDITTRIYHVLEIDGSWYVAEVLTDML